MPQDIVVKAPAQMDTVANCRGWDFRDLPDPSDCRIVIDLERLRSITASAVVGILATLADLYERGYAVVIRRPRNDYVNRMLATMGFVDAISTFAEANLDRFDADVRPVDRYLPVIKAQAFRTDREVEDLANDLTTQFQGHHELLPPSLLQEVTTVLAEAANNAVEHSKSPHGGFAVVQVRRRQVRGGPRAYFVEIAVADAGIGIADALGRGKSDEASIMDALEEGVTGTGQPTRGRGLYEIQQLVQQGRFRYLLVHSGNGQAIQFSATSTKPLLMASATIKASFPGTVVTVVMPVQPLRDP